MGARGQARVPWSPQKIKAFMVSLCQLAGQHTAADAYLAQLVANLVFSDLNPDGAKP